MIVVSQCDRAYIMPSCPIIRDSPTAVVGMDLAQQVTHFDYPNPDRLQILLYCCMIKAASSAAVNHFSHASRRFKYAESIHCSHWWNKRRAVLILEQRFYPCPGSLYGLLMQLVDRKRGFGGKTAPGAREASGLLTDNLLSLGKGAQYGG